MARSMIVCLAFLLMSGFLAETVHAGELHVSPKGDDKHAGTADAPLQTIGAALARIRNVVKPMKIVLHEGVYNGEHIVRAPDKLPKDGLGQLIIRAADGANVIFDGGSAATSATERQPGVYVFEGRTAAMWETDARVRYVEAGDERTVLQSPGTFVNADGKVTFHTSDSQPAASHRVGYARDNFAFRVMRPNVVIDGLHFQNYLAGTWSCGVFLNADHGTIRNCTARNSRAGFFTYLQQSPRIENCVIEDIGCGIYAMGKDIQLFNNTIVKTRDRFVVPTYWQDDTGIQCYYPAKGGEIEGNVVIGFAQGIYCKCNGTFRVEYNTVIDSHGAIYRSKWQNGNVYRFNVIVGTVEPFHNPNYLRAGTEVNENLIWQPENLVLFHDCLKKAAMAGNTGNVVADPLFVDAQAGDYRLMPNSPAVRLAKGSRPWGAMPAVDATHVDKQPPTVKLSLRAPAKASGSFGVEFFERDPWNGGGRSQVRQHRKADPEVDYITSSQTVEVIVVAHDAADKPRKIQMRFNGEPWGEVRAFLPRPKVKLPDGDAVHQLDVRVADGNDNWSTPASLRIRLQNTPPVLVDQPVFYSNANGAIVSFVTDRLALATLVLPDGRRLNQPMRVKRHWDVMAGGDEVIEWTEPRTVHHVPILDGIGPTYHIELRDVLGNSTTTDEFFASTGGQPKTLTVGPDGRDVDGAPVLKTIQFAVDRALPGDTVLIKPGVYTEEVFIGHGGKEGAPITIRGKVPGKVILDGVRRLSSLFRLENAPHIHLDQLEIRWFTRRGSGVYAADSPNLSVTNCKIWNMHFDYAWGEGYGLFLHRSPNLRVDHNLIFRMEIGVLLLDSPGAQVTYNTGVQCLLGAVGVYVRSGHGTVIQNNCFTFNGNDQLYFEELSPGEFGSLHVDYNNLGTVIGKAYGKDKKADRSVKPPHRLINPQSKAIVYFNAKRFLNMDSYREVTGFGKHSIYADPKFVDPVNHNFHLRPDSPNIGAGTDGSTIGAFGTE